MKQSAEPVVRVSIGDVARASGVSVATVSRVLNGLGGVGGETAEHVRVVVGRLGYRPLRARRRRPSPSSRDARAGAGTGNVAVIALGQASDWLQLPVMAAAVDGIRSATDSAGYRLILSEVIDPASPGTLFEKREVDGAIVFVSSGFKTEAVAAALRLLGGRLPVVWAMGGPLAVDVDHVYPDHQRIGELAYQYLSDRGCREVAYVTTSPTWPLMRVRGHAFLDAACDAGRPARAFILSSDPTLAVSYGRHVTTAADAPRLVEKLAAAKPALDGAYIANDRTTTELYPMLVRAGLRPGRDLAIVSCDNEEPRLAALDPRPATIDIRADQIGRRAVAQLLTRMAHPDDPPVTSHVSPRLVAAGE